MKRSVHYESPFLDNPSQSSLAIAITLATIAHLIAFFLLLHYTPRPNLSNASSSPINIKILPTSKNNSTAKSTISSQDNHIKNSTPKTFGVQKPKNYAENRIKIPATIPAQQTSPPPIPPPQPEVPKTQSAIEALLPRSIASWAKAQQEYGKVLSDAPAGGDIVRTPNPKEDQHNPFRSKVQPTMSVEEWTIEAYFDQVSRRFTDSWGPYRSVSRERFFGKEGELINYDLFVNRDGTLRKVINRTALEQPNRDFSAVDEQVREVLSHVFPMHAPPSRINRDPLILRKTIQYTGVRYFLF